MSKLISLVVPVYNEEKNIPVFWNKLQETINKLTTYQWEVLFVNDGSCDKTIFELEKNI